jgi:isoprenylcysteine carboxyl methyltransferase (ICMT) family protein YpbQ
VKSSQKVVASCRHQKKHDQSGEKASANAKNADYLRLHGLFFVSVLSMAALSSTVIEVALPLLITQLVVLTAALRVASLKLLLEI